MKNGLLKCHILSDSVIYISKPDMVDPPTGDNLGDLTNELPPGTFITEYIGPGPKNYGYELSNGTTVCKIRGFCLNYKNSKVINFDTLKDMVLQGSGGKTIENEHKISRDARKRKIVNTHEKKRYSLVYTKRVVLPDLSTVPFGY